MSYFLPEYLPHVQNSQGCSLTEKKNISVLQLILGNNNTWRTGGLPRFSIAKVSNHPKNVDVT